MGSDVLTLVTCDLAEIRRYLQEADTMRVPLVEHVGSSLEEIEALVAAELPDVLLLCPALLGAGCYEFCKRLKQDENLQQIHVVMVFDSAPPVDALQSTAESGCDDIMALPIHIDDFYHHIAHISGMHVRGPKRVAVALDVLVEQEDGSEATGSVVNLSHEGLGLQLGHPIELGPITVTLTYGKQRYDHIEAEAMWCLPNAEGAAVGVRVHKAPPPARGLMARLSLYELSPARSGQGVTVILQGIFDENTDFGPLRAALQNESHIDFALQSISYMSSAGVRGWYQFIEDLGTDKSYTFRGCSLPFCAQAAMVPMVAGVGRFVSVQAPYFCNTCDREETRLIETALVVKEEGRYLAPPLHCHICNSSLEFDDIPERYFAFLG